MLAQQARWAVADGKFGEQAKLALYPASPMPEVWVEVWVLPKVLAFSAFAMPMALVEVVLQSQAMVLAEVVLQLQLQAQPMVLAEVLILMAVYSLAGRSFPVRGRHP